MYFYLQIIAFDELKTDYKNPIDQCASLNPVSKKCTTVNLVLVRTVKNNYFSLCTN